MITFRITTDVQTDRRVVLDLPLEVPTGKAELVVTIASVAAQKEKPRRSSLAEWAEQQAAHWGSKLSSSDFEGFTGRRF